MVGVYIPCVYTFFFGVYKTVVLVAFGLQLDLLLFQDAIALAVIICAFPFQNCSRCTCSCPSCRDEYNLDQADYDHVDQIDSSDVV